MAWSVAGEGFKRRLRPAPLIGLQVDADDGEVPYELRNALLVPRLAVVGKCPQVHFKTTPDPPVWPELDQGPDSRLDNAARARVANLKAWVALGPVEKALGGVGGENALIAKAGHQSLPLKGLTTRGGALHGACLRGVADEPGHDRLMRAVCVGVLLYLDGQYLSAAHL